MVIGSNRTKSSMALSTSQAKAWVKTHYERHEDGVVAKAVMYKHYEDFCRQEGRSNMETSIFGRVVKNVFSDVTIRRLGGRDNLKYYYCGIRAKESSPHAIDNDTTTRPKRRLRKRELVTNKAEVDICLRWLHAHFVDSHESSVVKTEVYDRYVSNCHHRSVEPLSIQYFGMVVTHAFPHVTKRKLGPRTNQQKYYFGIAQRPSPMSLDNVPREYLSMDTSLSPAKSSYRDCSNVPEEDEDEFNCRSPSSDISDQTLVNCDNELQDAHPQYMFASYIKEEVEPVDYSLSTLRLKTEPVEEDLMIKCEPSDLQLDRDCSERHTPDAPSSVTAAFECMSPIEAVKKSNPRKIYKPRFHFDYDDNSSWNYDDTDGRDQPPSHSYYSTDHDAVLNKWISNHLSVCSGVQLDRIQVFSFYEKYCDLTMLHSAPLTHFDQTMLKELEGLVTRIHPSGKTYYVGAQVRSSSLLKGSLDEYNSSDHSVWPVDEEGPQSMDMSPSGESSPAHTFPLSLEDEEVFNNSTYQCTSEEHTATPQVLRDGKYFLRHWLKDNFEPVDDSCVLKADAYKHYESYARSINQTPFEMNVFGKIVWQVFPDVSVRRLGGRSKPQYHYCGITVKPTSKLYQVMSGKDPAQRSRKKEIATDNRNAEIVIDWLRSSYETAKDRIITKSEVFHNYNAYSHSIGEAAANLNYFGKLLKHCFPGVEVRKFGGRSEPTWCYYGLAPKDNASIYRLPEDNINKETLPHLIDIRYASPVARGISPLPRDSPLHMQRNSTNPIAIVGPRSSSHMLGTPTGHSFGSPLLFQDHPSVSHVTSPSHGSSPRDAYEPHSTISPGAEVRHLIGSPSDASFGRGHRHAARSPFENPEIAAEIMFSRSPIETESHASLLYPSANIPRDHLHSSPKFTSHFGGQVVPSQTPPSLVHPTGVDPGLMAFMHAQIRQKKTLTPEMFGSFPDMVEGGA